MSIDASSVAIRGYSSALSASAPSTATTKPSPEASETSFSAFLKGQEETISSGLTSAADPQALVQAIAETELAIETAVTIRNKVVEAYQEILRMPV